MVLSIEYDSTKCSYKNNYLIWEMTVIQVYKYLHTQEKLVSKLMYDRLSSYTMYLNMCLMSWKRIKGTLY